MQSFDSIQFRKVLGQYPTGVCVITATSDGGAPHALVVGSFTSISLDPPLVGFFPAKNSLTWQAIAKIGRFCVNVLNSDQVDQCQQIAKGGEGKLDQLCFAQSPSGQPILEGCTAWIDCVQSDVYDVGDHWMVVGNVEALDTYCVGAPLVFHAGQYHRTKILN